MTTPERIRRRQRRHDIAIVILALTLALGSIWVWDQNSDSQRIDDEQDRRTDRVVDCLIDYIEADAATGKVRSGLVADESQALRTIIRRTFNNPDTAYEAYADYREELRRIDKARADNPVQEFDAESTCR